MNTKYNFKCIKYECIKDKINLWKDLENIIRITMNNRRHDGNIDEFDGNIAVKQAACLALVKSCLFQNDRRRTGLNLHLYFYESHH